MSRARWLTFAIVLVVFLLGVTCVSAQQTYVIHVAVERPTFDDYLALSDWYQATVPGAPLPPEISIVGAAAVADVATAAALRVDATGVLTLDDGGRVALEDGDELHVGAYVAGDGATRRLTPVVVIVKGHGVAAVIGRTDLLVPASL